MRGSRLFFWLGSKGSGIPAFAGMTGSSLVPVRQLEIAPALAVDPQGNEHVFDRDVTFAELHAVGREHRRLVAVDGVASGLVHEDAAVAAMFVVPHRVVAGRLAAFAEVGWKIAVHVGACRSDDAVVARLEAVEQWPDMLVGEVGEA